MQNRDGMRPRQIDDNKPFQVIKDIESTKKTLPPEEKKELEKIENNLKKVINHFENKKKIQIPKTIILENNNLNNNEKNDKKKQNTNKNNSDIPIYELKEYKRPENYIIYSSKERDEPRSNDYEAKYSDQIFLKYHGNFMKLEVLEKIIITLENNICKGEKIPDEMAKKIIEENFSPYKSKSDLIIKHFNERRNELKKSLLRKYWRVQKSTDKYFSSTFRKREREKMKIRKNNQKKEESFEKMKMAGDLCRNHLFVIINAMKEKESLSKKIALIDNIMFISEINKIQNNYIPIEYINQNKEIISSLKEKGITINDSIIRSNEEKEKFEELKDDQSYIGDRGTSLSRVDILKEESINKDGDSYIIENKKNSQELSCPPINIVYLKSLKEKNKLKRNNKYRVRIRFNRIRKITVDRYIQKIDSMNPFDDSFNENIMKYQKYEPNLAINCINYNCFENLIKEYYEKKYKFLSFFSDNEEEYESFFKTKKNNKRLINKKRSNNK